MGRRPLFSVAGIPVRVQPWFFLVIGLLGFLLFPPPRYTTFLVSWIIVATLSILLHEFGHAIAFRAFGLKPSITLHGMGGLTSASTGSGTPEFTPARSIVTSLAGPLSALFLFGIPAWYLATNHGFHPWALFLTSGKFAPDWNSLPPSEVVLAQIVYVNIGWSLLNLVPMLPLDGGNVVASISEIITPRNGRRVANVVSIVVAVLFGLWGLSAGIITAPVFAALFVGLNFMEMSRGGGGDDADRELAEATRALIDYDPNRAEQLAWTVLTQSPSGERYRWATELTAWARVARGDVAGAQQAIATMAHGAGPSASLLAALALARGNIAEGDATMAWAFAHDGHKPAKVLGAMATAQSGQTRAVATELLRMGPKGREAAAVLQGLLEYAGHRSEAGDVTSLLAGAPH